MSRDYQILWLNGIYDFSTIKSFTSVSSASNYWNKEFVNTLNKNSQLVYTIGHVTDRPWPLGALMISRKKSRLSSKIDGEIVWYLNIYFFRNFILTYYYKKFSKNFLALNPNIKFIVTYSCIDNANDYNAQLQCAKFLKSKFSIKWINIVADGQPPNGPDAFIFLSWNGYKNFPFNNPKIHIDGGIKKVFETGKRNSNVNIKTFVYFGSLGIHGGIAQFAEAFHQFKNDKIKLLICGQGSNSRIDYLQEKDKRIVYKGFVSEKELKDIAVNAYTFINPRVSSFEPNNHNFPSKLLYYLSFKKPIISVKTPGISPEYDEILTYVENESVEGYISKIKYILSLNYNQYNQIISKIDYFNKNHNWNSQIKRFLSFIKIL